MKKGGLAHFENAKGKYLFFLTNTFKIGTIRQFLPKGNWDNKCNVFY